MKTQKIINEVTDEQIADVERRSREADETEPRIASAMYDAVSGRVVVEFRGGALAGAQASFPARSLRGLENAGDEQLAAIRVPPSGTAIMWPQLDVDASPAGLLRAVFGLRSLAARSEPLAENGVHG